MLNQLMGAQQHMMLFGCLNAEERLSSFLHWLSERLGAPAMLFDVPMSRPDIADYLGLTVETVCRTLSKLKREGFVKLKPSHQMVVEHPSQAATQRGPAGGLI